MRPPSRPGGGRGCRVQIRRSGAVQETSVPEPPGRPAPLGALAGGVGAAVPGAALEEGSGALVGSAIAALGATSAMVSLQDPDRPEPARTLTIGPDESAGEAGVAGLRDPGHQTTTA